MESTARRGGTLFRIVSSLAAVSSLLLLSGCLATQQEIEDLRGDILRLQNTLAKTQSDFQNSVQGNQADLLSEMGTLNRNLQILSSHLDESDNRMTMLSSRLDDLDKNLSNRLD